jgi:LysR family glycine cleavage system transcriptional activator
LSYFDFRTGPLDAAIHFGEPNWPGSEMVLLRSGEVIPACSADLNRELGSHVPGDLSKTPLLGVSTRLDAWDRRFSAHNGSMIGDQPMIFDEFATAAQAAFAGVGAALPPNFLIQEELT